MALMLLLCILIAVDGRRSTRTSRQRRSCAFNKSREREGRVWGEGSKMREGSEARSNKRKSQISCQQAAQPSPLHAPPSTTAKCATLRDCDIDWETHFWLTTGCLCLPTYPAARRVPLTTKQQTVASQLFAPVYPSRGSTCDACALRTFRTNVRPALGFAVSYSSLWSLLLSSFSPASNSLGHSYARCGGTGTFASCCFASRLASCAAYAETETVTEP